jgi:hypothetical protein
MELVNEEPGEIETCLVAYRSPTEVVLYGSTSNEKFKWLGNLRLDPEFLEEIDADEAFSDVNSIEVLNTEDTLSVFLGMRHGSVMTCQLISGPSEVSFLNTRLTRFGGSPVEFISAAHDIGGMNYVYLTSDYMWGIRHKREYIENRITLGVEEILFDDFRMVFF